MKIAFDENTPAAMVRLFQGFQQERSLRDLATGITIGRAQDYYPTPDDPDFVSRSDAPWIRRFAAEGGRAVISADAAMRRKPHERLALVEAQLVVIFFSSAWSGWKFCRKCSLLIHWWPTILTVAKKGKPGFYSVPTAWPEEGKAKLQGLPTDDLRLVRIERQLAQRATVQRRRRRLRDNAGASGDLFDEGTQDSS